MVVPAMHGHRVHFGLFMSAEYQATAVGWTLEEALRSTADRSLLRWVDLATLDEKPATDELNYLETALWMHVREGRLVATGSIKGAASAVLNPEYVADCQVVNWRESVIKRHGKRAITVQGVRIHSILRSPDAVSHLYGKGLADAFRMFVLEDPEVAALNALQRNPSSLKKGMRPGPSSAYHWSLNITAEALAYAYVDSFFHDPGKPHPTASTEQHDISFALADRLSALRDLLATGRVTARGTLSQTGEVVSIDSFQWKREGIFIHALNGDLCTEENNRPVPIWSGLSFLVTRNGSPRKRPVQKKSRKPNISAHFSSVREAAYAEWPDGVPDSLTVGSRDRKIIAWQRINAPTIVSGKTIERYFKKYGSLHRKKTTR
jgi:hypothetical protein